MTDVARITEPGQHALELGRKCEDMIATAYVALRQFPKFERHVLGAEIRQSLWQLLRLVTICGRRYHKKTTLEQLAVEIDMLRSYVRTAMKLKYLSFDKYERWQRQIDEIGRMIGSWINKLRAREQRG